MPSKEIVGMAEIFAGFVGRHNWKFIEKQGWAPFNDEDMKTVKDLLVCAGFEVEAVQVGTITHPCRNEDHDPTGETYTLNKSCPFKAVLANGKDHERATLWLDIIFRRLLEIANEHEKVKFLAAEIEKNIP